MVSFTTRVELHNATYSDYTNLHAAMERRRFRRLIQSDDGRIFQLPTAEYDSQGNISATEVLNLAIAAANETGKTSSILVSEAISRQWYNLPLA